MNKVVLIGFDLAASPRAAAQLVREIANRDDLSNAVIVLHDFGEITDLHEAPAELQPPPVAALNAALKDIKAKRIQSLPPDWNHPYPPPKRKRKF